MAEEIQTIHPSIQLAPSLIVTLPNPEDTVSKHRPQLSLLSGNEFGNWKLRCVAVITATIRVSSVIQSIF